MHQLTTFHGCVPAAPEATPLSVPSFTMDSSLSEVVATACPDLQCLLGIDLSTASPDSINNISVNAKGSTKIFSLLPISLLVNINRFMLGPGKPDDPRNLCGVPVLSGAELLALKVDDVDQEFYDAVVAASKIPGLQILKSTLISQVNKQVLGVCSKLPIEEASTLAKRQFIWGALGVMQLQAALDAVYLKYPWFQSTNGMWLQELLGAMEDFAVCAAANPCTGDFLFAFNGLAGSFSIPIEPPLNLEVEDAGLKSIAWSSGDDLQTTVSAWDPLELHMPIAYVYSLSAQIFQVKASFRIEVGAKLGVSIKAPMVNYVKSLAKIIDTLSVKVLIDFTGLV